MSRHLLALAIAAALSTTIAGCSDSNDSDDDGGATGGAQNGGDGGGAGGGDAGGGGGGDTGTPAAPVGNPTAPSGGGAPSGDTKAGVYNGDLGFGDDFLQGVYVIDNEFNLSGVALANSGNARAIFGELGGEDTFTGQLREYALSASRSTASDDVSFSVGGNEPTATPEFDLTFSNGNTIQGSETRGAALSIAQQPNPATFATTAGTWTADNAYLDCAETAADAACRLVTELTFGTDGTVTGETYLASGDGSFTTYRNPIVGRATEFGDALLVNLNWGSTGEGNLNAYSGAVFFDPTTGARLIYAVESQGATANPRTLAAIMTRQQ